VARTAADAVRRIGIKLPALAQDGLTYAANDAARHAMASPAGHLATTTANPGT